MIPLRLVIDANIVVSAALKPDGLQRTVLILALTKPATLYVTEAILAEYRNVPQRASFRIPKGRRQQLLHLIANRARSVRPARIPQVSPIPTTTCSWNAPIPRAPITL